MGIYYILQEHALAAMRRQLKLLDCDFPCASEEHEGRHDVKMKDYEDSLYSSADEEVEECSVRLELEEDVERGEQPEVQERRLACNDIFLTPNCLLYDIRVDKQMDPCSSEIGGLVIQEIEQEVGTHTPSSDSVLEISHHAEQHDGDEVVVESRTTNKGLITFSERDQNHQMNNLRQVNGAGLQQCMTLLTRSQTKAMDRKVGESLLAYEERLAAFIQEANDRAAAAAKERNRLEQEEEAKRQKEEQDRLRQEEADLQAAAEHRSCQRERLFTRETMIGDEAAHWVEVTSADGALKTEKELSALAQVSHDLVATCALQQEEILHLQQTVDQMLARLQALEKQPAAVAAAGPSTLTTHVQVLEDDVSNIKRVHQDSWTSQQATNLQLETLDMHHVPSNDRHPCLYHRSGGACQALLDNILTSHGVAVSELHTKLTWQELTDAWHKRFQVEPPDLQAMDKLNKLHQNTLLSQDWITEFQRLASTPDLPLAFRAIKHLFIMRSCAALQNALTQIAETLDTSDKLFNTASRIILTNIEARNAVRSSATTSGTQPKPKVACITSTEAATPNEGEVLAAAREGGRPRNNHGRDKTKTQSTSTPSTGSAADEPWAQYGLSANSYRTRLKYRYCLWCNSTIHDAAHCPTKGKPRQGK
ncbi:hypothetical protein CBR_g28562 [Chara braunii]|uniref:Uncharacterized protein n=1 Tax=Chara braunii TaxID=69332 RepID=A0A388JWA7_CHABU|nr:hypothetical protein CBR_g28562 [Chara braunii]|eukprot:GBG62086.1 hypothetical protein CBR_g28562 [Chara braunii]